jgi:glycosyltransferase involved in cell wall biosynthesis
VIVAISRAGVRGLAPHVRAPIVLIDNAVDVGSYRQGMRASVTAPIRVLYVGTVSVRKGLVDLLQAAVALRNSGTRPWTLTIAGPPGALREDDAAGVIRLYQQAGFGASLVGPKTPDEVRSLMETSDLLVLPSHSEGQPIAVLEAMAAGLPIVATTVGAVPEIIDGGVGILLDAGDIEALIAALRGLIEDDERRRDLGLAARRRAVERYDTARLERSLASLWYRLSSRRLDRDTRFLASDDPTRRARHSGSGPSLPRIDARDGRITRG